MASDKTTKKTNPPKREPELDDQVQNQNQEIDYDDSPLQRELLFQWESYERPYRPLNKQVFSTLVAFVLLLSVVLYFLSGITAVILLISVMFLFYVLGTVQPAMAIHSLDTWGIETHNKLYVWDIMTHYWFEDYGESRVLVIGLTSRWPRFLRIVLDTEETEDILNEVLAEILIKYHPEPNWLDKSTNWLEQHIQWDTTEDA